MNLASYLEYTDLRPTITGNDIDKLVRDAIEFGFFGVCIPPFWVKRAKREINSQDLKIITVAGFPMGYTMTESRLDEIARGIESGADEIDLVMNISAFKSGSEWTKVDLAKASKLTHESGKILKVIIETSLLSQDEMVQASKMAVDAGADFIKTSTGFNGTGARVEHVSLIRKSIPQEVGIKASGGIRTRAQVLSLIEAGASRIGTSTAISIVN